MRMSKRLVSMCFAFLLVLGFLDVLQVAQVYAAIIPVSVDMAVTSVSVDMNYAVRGQDNVTVTVVVKNLL